MANNISKITKYLPDALDQYFVLESLTALFDENSKNLVQYNPSNAEYVKVAKMQTSPLANYRRANGSTGTANDRYSNFSGVRNGYPIGDVAIEWEQRKIAYDRARQLQIDYMDDEEVAGLSVAQSFKQMSRNSIVPEIDITRFNRMIQATDPAYGNRVIETIQANKIIEAFNNALEFLNDKEVGTENLVFFVSNKVMTLIRNTTEISRYLVNDALKIGEYTRTVVKYEGIPIIPVPSNRFYTDVVLPDEGGYAPSSTSKLINFILARIDCAQAIKKVNKIQTFDPSQNQDFDGWKINFRLFHDFIIWDNQEYGFYASISSVDANTIANVVYPKLKFVSSNTYQLIGLKTTVPGLLYSKIVYQEAKMDIGSTYAPNGSTIKEIFVNGANFTQIGSGGKGYFAVVDANNKALAVSSQITLPTA